MIFVNIRNLINRLVLFIYNKSKRYLIVNGVFVKLEPTLNVKYTDIIILQSDYQQPVHDNDFYIVKANLKRKVINDIKKMLDHQILITYNYNENDLDNNFLLTAKARIKILKQNIK